ncbi:MAG: ABC transporter permease, partial [Gemmatimonadales bacterium]|nr:ABC transporter permease [Gemmatimonadales bacterium]
GFPVAEQFWRPLRIDLARTPRGQGRLDVFGRLRAGTTLDAARGEFAVISAGLAEAYPETNRGLSANLSSFRDEYVGEEFTRLVYTMLAGSILVLLIACANVTNLLIARGASRSRDVGVRMALGASRGQVVRQFLVEGAVLAGIGAVGGVAIGAIGISWFEAGARAGVFTLPHGSDSLFWWDIRLNAVSVLFAVGATGIAALCAGLVPALSTLRAAPAVALRDASRGSTSRPTARLSRALVVVEFALTTGLALAAGLTVRSVLNVTGVADAFRSEGIRTGRAALPLAQAGFSEAAYPDHASRLLFAERLLAETRAQPGVTLAAVANVLPNEPGPSTSLAVAGVVPESGAGSSVRVATVSDDYFAVFGGVPLEGRTFTAADRAGGEPVAMINRSLAERHFGGRSPLHERIRLGEDGDEPWLTIVGVVPDLWAHDDPARDLSRVFVPLAQSGTADPTIRLGRWGLRFLTLAAAGGETVLPPPAVFRSAAAAIDPAIPVYAEQPMAEVVALRTARFRLFGRYYLAFGAVALSLAVIGLYGVMAGSVARRRSEFGIRMALGAGRQVVLGEVMGQALRQVAAGLALGGVVAWWLASGLRAALFRVELVDPPVLLGVPLLLVLTGVLAGLLPALRASRVNPTDAIRSN